MSSFRASLVQAAPALGDMKANLSTVVDALRREESDLVVFPELFLSGYMMRDGLRQCAEPLDGPSVRELEAACRVTGKHVVVGFPRKGEATGIHHNSVVLVGPQGVVGHYDKVYLPTFSVFEEKLYFKEGNRLPVFDTPLGKIGLTICYDLFFPEVPKALALAGADVIVCASASPSVSRQHFEAVFAARAIENTTWVLYSNVSGPQDTLQFWGGAQAWGPRGDLKVKGPYDVEAVTRVEVDLDEVAEARLRRPTLRDTRPEVLRRLYDAACGT